VATEIHYYNPRFMKRGLPMTDAIIAEVNELESLLLQCRSVFPTLSESLIGRREFETPTYYAARGYRAQIQLEEPITAEFIMRNRRLCTWINENAIIRLFGIMKKAGARPAVPSILI
jgi:hypothetical protein